MSVILNRRLAAGFYLAILGDMTTGSDALEEVPSAPGGTALSGGRCDKERRLG